MASPILTGVEGATFNENAVNAAPQVIDSDVTFSDADEDFTGGLLRVTGVRPEDRISILEDGRVQFDTGMGFVTVDGVIVALLEISNAGQGVDFEIRLLNTATSAVIETIIEHLTYANVSDTPTANRELTINVIDEAGNDLNDHPVAFAVNSADPISGLSNYYRSRPALGDIDGDGDMDLLVGDWHGAVRYFENVGTATAPSYVLRSGAQNPFSGVSGTFPTPALTDWDGDGDLDMVVGDQGSTLNFFLNQGTAEAPAYAHAGSTWATGPTTVPTFADIDGDGDMDLIVGNQFGSFNLLRNDGSPSGAIYNYVGDLNVSLPGFSAPVFLDVDGDGDLDLVSGTQSGALRYFENTGDASVASFTERTGGANPFDGIAGRWYSIPTVADVDGDGDLDLVIGDSYGDLKVIRNNTPHAPTITIHVIDQGEPVVGDNSSQTLTGSALGELIQGLDGDDFLDAGAGDDTLEGGAGADYLRGGEGADAMIGGAGDDTYVVDDAGDTTSEVGGSGIDRVHSRISWTLADEIENLTLGSAGGDINGYGNGWDNVIDGNAGSNQLFGYFGADMLNGGGGHDSLWGGHGADLLDGGNGNDALYGEGDVDALTGGAGNDVLDGGYGDDFMAGGTGNDTYYVDSALDELLENAGEGTDTVFASTSWTLADDFENLTLVGPTAYNGTGNALNNVITGTSDYNTLQGGDGRDTIDGAGWDDGLYGDAGNDIILGGDGNDQIWGGAGSDRLTGGADQDDFYFTDNDVRLSTLGLTPERDTIVDFTSGADEINLTFIDANVNVGGDQDFALVTRFTGAAGQLVIKFHSPSNSTIAEMDVDGDGKADFRITLEGGDFTDHVGWYF